MTDEQAAARTRHGEVMKPDVIILSPHFDDAALSCWRMLSSEKEVLVVNVFAGAPPAGMLGWWDKLAGASDSAAVVRTRVEEDRQALAFAGRTAVNLPLLDSQYREDDAAPEEIVDGLNEVPVGGARIYAPADLGDSHRDHAAVRAAALALRAKGADVTLYADLPHATVEGWPRWVLDDESPACTGPASELWATQPTGTGLPPAGADPAGELWATQLTATGLPLELMTPTVHRLSTDDHARKLAAVLSYRSQIAPLQETYGRSLEDPQLLGLEVEWRLPPT